MGLELDEIEAFHRAAQRHRTIVTVIGALAMMVCGLAAFAIASSLEAPWLAQGRRIATMTGGLAMFATGIVMFVRRRT